MSIFESISLKTFTILLVWRLYFLFYLLFPYCHIPKPAEKCGQILVLVIGSVLLRSFCHLYSLDHTSLPQTPLHSTRERNTKLGTFRFRKCRQSSLKHISPNSILGHWVVWKGDVLGMRSNYSFKVRRMSESKFSGLKKYRIKFNRNRTFKIGSDSNSNFSGQAQNRIELEIELKKQNSKSKSKLNLSSTRDRTLIFTSCNSEPSFNKIDEVWELPAMNFIKKNKI